MKLVWVSCKACPTALIVGLSKRSSVKDHSSATSSAWTTQTIIIQAGMTRMSWIAAEIAPEPSPRSPVSMFTSKA